MSWPFWLLPGNACSMEAQRKSRGFFQYTGAGDSKHPVTLEEHKSARLLFEFQEMQEGGDGFDRDYLKGRRCMVWSSCRRPDVRGPRGLWRPAGYGGNFHLRGRRYRHPFGNRHQYFLHDDLHQQVAAIHWMLTVMNHGTASIFTALRNNTNGAKDKFLTELVRIMEKYRWCAGVDIDLERGGGYENREAANALFQAIYQTVKTYDSSKLVNICLPGMTGVQGSVGGENWCVYADLNPYCDTALHYVFMAWRGQAAPPPRYPPGVGWRASTITPLLPWPREDFMGLPGYGWNWQIYDHSGEPWRNLPGCFQHLLCRKLWMTGAITSPVTRRPSP